MEGFLGVVDRDGAPILAPSMDPRNLGPKQGAPNFKDGVPILATIVKPERSALTVHEILESVTDPPAPCSTGGLGGQHQHQHQHPPPPCSTGHQGGQTTARHPGLRVLMQKEFESRPGEEQQSVATFRLTNPGKLISEIFFLVLKLPTYQDIPFSTQQSQNNSLGANMAKVPPGKHK